MAYKDISQDYGMQPVNPQVDTAAYDALQQQVMNMQVPNTEQADNSANMLDAVALIRQSFTGIGKRGESSIPPPDIGGFFNKINERQKQRNQLALQNSMDMRKMQLEVMRTSIEMQMAKHEEARKALESATRVKETEIDIRNKRGAGKRATEEYEYGKTQRGVEEQERRAKARYAEGQANEFAATAESRRKETEIDIATAEDKLLQSQARRRAIDKIRKIDPDLADRIDAGIESKYKEPTNKLKEIRDADPYLDRLMALQEKDKDPTPQQQNYIESRLERTQNPGLEIFDKELNDTDKKIMYLRTKAKIVDVETALPPVQSKEFKQHLLKTYSKNVNLLINIPEAQEGLYTIFEAFNRKLASKDQFVDYNDFINKLLQEQDKEIKTKTKTGPYRLDTEYSSISGPPSELALTPLGVQRQYFQEEILPRIGGGVR